MLSGLGVISPIPPRALAACSTAFRGNPISMSVWTVVDGGGDDICRARGRLRRDLRKSRDVTALPMAAQLVTVPVCSELASPVAPIKDESG